jgi:hypothetical protein
MLAITNDALGGLRVLLQCSCSVSHSTRHSLGGVGFSFRVNGHTESSRTPHFIFNFRRLRSFLRHLRHLTKVRHTRHGPLLRLS